MGIEVIGGVVLCTGAERAATCGRTAHNGWAADPRSLSVMPERTAAGGVSPNRWMQLLGEAPNEGEGLGVSGHALGRAPAGMQDGRVVATREARADGGEGLTGVLAREVHRDLARPGEAGRAAGGEELLAAEAEGIGGDVLDGLDGERRGALARTRGVEVGEDLVREIGREGAPGERGEGDDADEGALEHAQAVGRSGGEEGQNAVVGQDDA